MAGNRVVDEVMHDPVPEIRRPDFPDFRVRHNKGDAAPDFVISAFKITVERDQIALKVGLEAQLIDGIALGPAASKIGVEHRLNRQVIIRHEFIPPHKNVRERGFNSGR